IGAAVAGVCPDLTLSGSSGCASAVAAGLVEAPNNVWCVGANASDALIDFGARLAPVRGARAAYDGTVASYRQVVLTAFEQMEDELATLRILEQQFDIQQKTVQSANLSLQLTLNQSRAGTVAYTS